jgi:hypothetical protein
VEEIHPVGDPVFDEHALCVPSDEELRERVGSLQKDRDQIRQELVEARSDLKTAMACADVSHAA